MGKNWREALLLLALFLQCFFQQLLLIALRAGHNMRWPSRNLRVLPFPQKPGAALFPGTVPKTPELRRETAQPKAVSPEYCLGFLPGGKGLAPAQSCTAAVAWPRGQSPWLLLPEQQWGRQAGKWDWLTGSEGGVNSAKGLIPSLYGPFA